MSNGVTKSIHPLYKESVLISVPDNELRTEGVEHWKQLAREHFNAEYLHSAQVVEVVREEECTYIIARGLRAVGA